MITSLRRAAALLAAGAAATVVSATPAHADVTAPGAGRGSISVGCSTVDDKLSITITQQSQYIGQRLWTDLYVYSYKYNKWYTARQGGPNQVSNSGLAYSWYNTTLEHGRFAVYVTYWWQQSNGTWIKGSEYAPSYPQFTSGLGSGYYSSSCWL